MLLLEKDPANRFPSASALTVALETRNVPQLPTTRSATDAASLSPRTASYGDAPAYAGGDGYLPSEQEKARWYAPQVERFRKKLAPFFAFSAVSVFLAVFNILGGLVGVAGLWSVYIAFQYAKLWTDGYDWRDVFKEPRDRLFFDVVAEWMDNVRALWDRRKRAEIRERNKLRGGRGPMLFSGQSASAAPGLPGLGAADISSLAGPYAAQVRDAHRNGDEIQRQFETLSRSDREMMSEVPQTAAALVKRVESIAMQLHEIERNAPNGSLQPVEAEIERLESEANPLDTRGSEERVRRLAFLKRQRRALSDISSRQGQARERLERCLLALQNMRLDLSRLKAGGQTAQQVTLVAEKAMELAREVDNAVYVADEMAKLRVGRGEVGGRR
jgi:serine/threonine-protein kinase